jgi:hypothetical protein
VTVLAALALAGALVATLVAGCSSGGGSTASPTSTASTAAASGSSPSGPASGGASSGTPAYCAAANKLKTSVQALGSLSVASGLSGVQTAIDNIQTSLNEFQSSAQSQFGPQIQRMRTSLSDVESAIRAAGASPNASSVTSIGTSAAAVVAAYDSLQKAISSRCG